jgi:hypothetical protein
MQTSSKLKLRLKRMRKVLTGVLDKVAQSFLESYCKKDLFGCTKTYFHFLQIINP